MISAKQTPVSELPRAIAEAMAEAYNYAYTLTLKEDTNDESE